MLLAASYFGLDRFMCLHFVGHMILRILVRFVGAVLFWRRFEGMSLRPFGADTDDYHVGTGGVVRCDGGNEGINLDS